MTADSGRVDDGQTNSVLFDLLICLAVERRSEPATADGLTTYRRILFFLTYLSGRRAPFRARDCGWVDDGQTNSVLFYLSVWPSSAVPSFVTADSGRVDDGQTNSVLFDLSVWSSNATRYHAS